MKAKVLRRNYFKVSATKIAIDCDSPFGALRPSSPLCVDFPRCALLTLCSRVDIAEKAPPVLQCTISFSDDYYFEVDFLRVSCLLLATAFCLRRTMPEEVSAK